MKSIYILNSIYFIILVIHETVGHVSFQPEQVHLALGKNGSEMVVTWSTFNATDDSTVEYGIDGLILRAEGSCTKFVDGGVSKRVEYIHKVSLKDLQPDSKYSKNRFLSY